MLWVERKGLPESRWEHVEVTPEVPGKDIHLGVVTGKGDGWSYQGRGKALGDSLGTRSSPLGCKVVEQSPSRGLEIISLEVKKTRGP